MLPDIGHIWSIRLNAEIRKLISADYAEINELFSAIKNNNYINRYIIILRKKNESTNTLDFIGTFCFGVC